MNWPPSKRKREEQEFYDQVAHEISTRAPLELYLRYEDANKVTTPYITWVFNTTAPIQSYSRVKLLSLSFLNNYSAARFSSLGLKIDELQIRPVQTANGVGPTWLVPNQTYSSTSNPNPFYQDVGAEPFYDLGSMGSLDNLTVTLYDGVNALTATGSPAGFFVDIRLLFTN